jgi:hypothetical protein
MSDSIQKTNGRTELRDLDELIALAKRRLVRIAAERSRELERGLTRLLHSNVYTDVVGDRLVDRLDEVLRTAENRLARLEDQRAAVLLKSIDALFPEAEV